jgi:acyl-CoA thioester hydrolase
MPREAFRFSHPLRVRWAEVDPQGIVFNANYLVYFDVAATEYWRALGFTYPAAFAEHGVDTFAVKATVEFHAPARYDDDVDLLVRTTRLGGTSLRVAVEVHRGDHRLVSGELVYVVASTADRRPTPIPPRLRAAIVAFEKTAPDGAEAPA